jgi:DNA-binding CsgD family transcriptional regulator
MRSLSRERVEQALAIVGLGLFIATMMIYSPTTTTLLVHTGIWETMAVFSPTMLSAACLAALICLILALRGQKLSQFALFASGSVLYAVGGIGYSVLALVFRLPVPVAILLAVCTGVGDVLLCLFFGRVFRHFGPRLALICVSASCAVSIASSWLFSHLDSLLVTIAFSFGIILTIVSGAVITRPFLLGSDDAPQPRVLPKTLLALGDVLSIPLLGLIACALTMAVMRGDIISSFDSFVAANLVVAAILLVFTWLQPRAFNLKSLQLTFIPLFAILLLTVNCLSTWLGLGQQVSLFMTYILYIAATLIALVSLTAVANSGEYGIDLVFSAGVLLFLLASALGVLFGDVLAGQDAFVTITIITTVYAFVVVLSSYNRWRRLDEWEDAEDAPTSTRQSIVLRCRQMADSHHLTERELEVLNYLAEGHNGAYISEVLFISPNTARTHIHNIYRKLEVSSREDILRLTREQINGHGDDPDFRTS